ncbi:MAG: divergent PAP2 family protein [Candidatus Caenarcaniphilales bacterium]|nr:divergent PAP2 family protein [Candidatus Caenarcaniphilales bacterium]
MAQALKIFINFIRFRKLDFGILVRTGGMPSSHSAMVTSLVTSIGIVEGWNTPVFALAVCFALIVMYDASGVRRSVGIQATILNQMIVELNNDNPELQFNRIKEFIGHTPFEVLAGATLGILMGFLVCFSVNKF